MSRLEDAMIAARDAMDARGLRVFLCRFQDADDVRANMLYLAASLQVGNWHLDVDLKTHSKHAEANTARNLALLAELLSAHLENEHELRGASYECKPAISSN